MSDIVLREADILNPEFKFNDKIEIAADVANVLSKVLIHQKLVVTIKGNKYVTASGWNTLGTMLGTYARTEEVTQFRPINGRIGYKARVSIMQGDNILSTAEAIATSDGFQTKEHAIYSMAQTRAMGKAYRMAFSWIIELAGFKATPAEEMTSEEIFEGELVREYHDVEPGFVTANNVEKVNDDPVARNWVKSLCSLAKKEGKPCLKGVLIQYAKDCTKLVGEEKEQVINYIKTLPKGEVNLE